ncbi:Signal recognition particle receptor subunit beta [Candida viswanathii]|uniref:Signal recognition particle receptor subunit beta n=1 Tax=Candida viswanathii TaxID=5486 RepID=A0A367XYR2_9ASCO|nr:Signal recognition particle receptor subunit beta [Candida viswanathii]
MDAVLIGLLTILAGFVIILAIFFIQTGGLRSISTVTKKSPYFHQTFLILGANNSGKTSLFNKLQDLDEQPPSTVSSIEPNVAMVSLPLANPGIGKKFQVIDYPGHLKLQKIFERLILDDITLKNMRGVVYMVDSSSVNINDDVNFEKIVKFLYNLFSITERTPNGVDFLIAVNKTDLFDSVPVHKIRSKLEAEINKLIRHEIENVGKTSGIDDSGKDDGDDGAGNNDRSESLRAFWMSVVGNGDFTFDKLEGNVDFVGGSALKNISQWENWLDERVVNP